MNGPIDPTAPLTPAEPGPPTTGGPAPGRPRRLVLWIALATLTLGGLIGAGLVVLLDGGGGGDGSEVGVATNPTVATTPTTMPATAPAATQPSTTPSEAAPPPVTEAPTTTLPRAEFVAPVITRFEITPADMSCLPGELAHPTVTWATEHATEVTLAVVGLADPVVMPMSGTAPLNIRCIPGETPQNIAYVLTARGPGGTTSRSVTVHITIT